MRTRHAIYLLAYFLGVAVLVGIVTHHNEQKATGAAPVVIAIAGKPAPTTTPEATPPQCATEDSTGCIWNAKTHGNGKGKSFVATNDGEAVELDDPTAWIRPDSGWQEALRDEDGSRDWSACWINVGETTVVICPDGTTWTS